MRGERAVGEGVCPSLGEAQGFFRPREIQWLGKAGNDIRWNEMAFPMKEPGNVIASIHSIEGHGLGLRDAHKDPEPAIWLQIVVLHVSSSKSGGGHQTCAIEAPQGTMDERSVNGRPVKFRFRWARSRECAISDALYVYLVSAMLVLLSRNSLFPVSRLM
jgi:hypothetical protein